eukprot:gnl/TRDRNA2_/TRDRNA2_174636_c0_seq1.p1 gnl/TRDRNA2_/TRDRNA2_174636_c0~~gnl/TRDRNA2_/TRDRNA2_174636_c0_seq1.p1  ORF type:complete len:396 (-),score=74.23 gnl/TRDRNA2_/TRDRNA2_174636_c0_seq1:74-1261(-)
MDRVVHPMSTWALVVPVARFASGATDEESVDSMTAWIGIGLNLLGCSIGCMGWLMQKFAHNEESAEKEEAEETEDKSKGCCGCCPSFFQNPLWLMGLCVFISGQIITAVSLGLAPQTIVSTLNCFTIIITFCVAPFFLGETIIVWRIVCVLVMICGCTSVMANGPHEYQEFTVHTLRQSLSDPWCVFVIFLISGGSVGSFYYMKSANRSPTVTQYCFYAAATSWFSVLTTKVFMSLIWTMIMEGSPSQLHYPDFWCAAALVGILAPSNVYLMNLALQAGDATIVVPTYDALAMCGQIVLGGFFFQEFEEMTIHQTGGFVFGVVVVVAGVYLISQDPPEDFEYFKQPLFQGRKTSKKMQRSDVGDEAKLPLKQGMDPQTPTAQPVLASTGGSNTQA